MRIYFHFETLVLSGKQLFVMIESISIYQFQVETCKFQHYMNFFLSGLVVLEASGSYTRDYVVNAYGMESSG